MKTAFGLVLILSLSLAVGCDTFGENPSRAVDAPASTDWIEASNETAFSVDLMDGRITTAKADTSGWEGF